MTGRSQDLIRSAARSPRLKRSTLHRYERDFVLSLPHRPRQIQQDKARKPPHTVPLTARDQLISDVSNHDSTASNHGSSISNHGSSISSHDSTVSNHGSSISNHGDHGDALTSDVGSPVAAVNPVSVPRGCVSSDSGDSSYGRPCVVCLHRCDHLLTHSGRYCVPALESTREPVQTVPVTTTTHCPGTSPLHTLSPVSQGCLTGP